MSLSILYSNRPSSVILETGPPIKLIPDHLEDITCW